jgi:hypothetical protein
MSDDVFWWSTTDLSRAFRRHELSPVEFLDHVLARAERLQPHLNFLVMLDPAGARTAAREAEARWMKGEPLSPLDGIPVSIKDTTTVKGWPTRIGSHATDESPAAEDAPVVGRLRAAGMTIIGKSTTPEFGWKALTDSPLQGTTRNPWNPGHTPGGSSGGASAMTAAGIGPFNHGNDGGGSIRIPAAHTGLVGLKPSFGRIAQHPADSPFADVVSQGVLAAQRARHCAGAECRGRTRFARLALAAGRGARLHDRPRRRRARMADRAEPRPRPCDGRSRGSRAGRDGRPALRRAGRACRGDRPPDRTAAVRVRAAVDRQLRQPPAPDPDPAARQARSRIPRGRREGPGHHPGRLRPRLRGEVEARP